MRPSSGNGLGRRRVLGWIQYLQQDARDALRAARSRPALTAVAVLTIAVGIGAPGSIFSFADAVVLRPLPYAAAERLFVIRERDAQRNTVGPSSYPAFVDWRDLSRSFQSLAAVTAEVLEVTLTGRGDAVLIDAAAVSGTFFQTLGGAAAAGRVLLPGDDRPGAAAAVVLSHALWRDRFGRDADVIGDALVLAGRPYTIVGVMPPEFAYPSWAQLWIPLRSNDALLLEEIAEGLFEDQGAGVNWLTVIARLQDGATLDPAQAELTAIWRRMYRRVIAGIDRQGIDRAAIDTYIDGHTAVPIPLSETILGPTGPVLLAILGASLLVLFIACANVAGLLAMRAVERRGEMAVRLTLGASRARLARAVFAESLLLAGAGACGGVLIAWWGTSLVASFAPAGLPRVAEVAAGARLLAFVAAAALLVAVVSALAPVALARHTAPERLIRRAPGRGEGGPGRARAVLVTMQVALAVVLLVVAGLTVQSFLNLRQAPFGFDRESLLTVTLAPKGGRYAEREPRRIFHQELLARVRALPGVDSAAFVTRRPLWSAQGYDWPYTAEGQPDEEAWRNPPVNLLAISSDYFRTMGIHVVRGRALTDADRDGQQGVVVVGESLARRAWPGLDPIGRRIRIPMPGTPYQGEWLTVAGVAQDSRYREPDATRLDLYVSHLQADLPLSDLMVRTSIDPAAVVRGVREATLSVDPDVPVMEAMRMSDVVSESLWRWRFTGRLFGAFAAAALVLATLGLYALVAYAVAARTREMGLRIALGARSVDVRRLVARYGLRLTMPGLLLGLGAVLLGGRVLEAMLYGVSVRDPITLALAPLALVLAAAGACALPALRATRVDPAALLREE